MLIAKIKPYRFFQLLLQLLTYTYSGFLIVYFILRLIFWDKLWIVALIGNFIPLILLPVLLLPLPAFFIIKKRWFSILSSIACFLLISWLHITYFSPQSSQILEIQPVKILTLNTSWFDTKATKLLGLIEGEKPDLVFLQEVTHYNFKQLFPQLTANYPYKYYDDNLENYHTSSVGIISKYPIQLREKIHLAGHIEVQQRMIVKIENQEVVIYNIEMTAPWIRQQKILPFFTIPSYDCSQRSAEIKDLINRIKQENLPVIAAGDFNLTDQSQDYYNLSQFLQDSFQISGWGFGWTWPTNWAMKNFIKTSTWKLSFPLFRLDYIWHSNHWQTKSSKVLPSIGAAHLPIVAELKLVNNRK